MFQFQFVCSGGLSRENKIILSSWWNYSYLLGINLKTIGSYFIRNFWKNDKLRWKYVKLWRQRIFSSVIKLWTRISFILVVLCFGRSELFRGRNGSLQKSGFKEFIGFSNASVKEKLKETINIYEIKWF